MALVNFDWIGFFKKNKLGRLQKSAPSIYLPLAYSSRKVLYRSAEPGRSHISKRRDGTNLFWVIVALLCGLWLTPLPLLAQETSTNEITIDEINKVARELWCPLCSGVRLDVCELSACDDMREQIGIQLANDASTEQIKAFFIEQYGPQVLGEPPLSGFNWLAWVVPIVALIAGAFLVLRRGRNMFAVADGFTVDDSSTHTAQSSNQSLETIDEPIDELIEKIEVQPQSDRFADALDKELEAYE